jgi:hypothetical protein
MKSKTKPFAGIPNRVIEQKGYSKLTHTELKLLVWFAYQYKGNNNGKLCAVYSQAKTHGINSQTSLATGLKGLLSKEYIQVTKGAMCTSNGRQPVYYAITWEKIDTISGFNMDVSPTKRAYRTFYDDIDQRKAG